jgi:serine protease Do
MNTAIAAHGRGVGFAIPIDDVRAVLAELHATGHVERGRLGVSFQAATSELRSAMKLGGEGALVTDIEKGSPAASSPLRPGDLVTAIDGDAVKNATDLARALGRRKPGDLVKLDLIHDGAAKVVEVRLDHGDDDGKRELTRVEPPRRARSGQLGAHVIDVPEGGVRVDTIEPTGAAAGSLHPGDIILDVNGAPIAHARDFAGHTSGARGPLVFRVRRGGSSLFLAVELP